MVLGSVLIIVLAGFGKGRKYLVRLLLIEYIFLIYCSTVIFRETEIIAKTNTSSFERYSKIVEDNGIHIVPEMLMNVLVFVPLGMLLYMAFNKLRWWYILIMGCCISISIEVLQFAFKCGTTEALDIFHNTLGCLIGIVIVEIIKGIWSLQKRDSMN